MTRAVSLLQIELEKLWRQRKAVLIGAAGLAAAITISSAALAPGGGRWQNVVQREIVQLRQERNQMQQAPAMMGASGPAAQVATVLDREIAMKSFLLQKDVAPASWYAITGAAAGIFQTSFPIFLLVFGWLAAETVAQERNNQTLALLLSRPVSRLSLLLAKAGALFVVAACVLSGALLVSYVGLGLLHGGWIAVNSNVLVFASVSDGALVHNALALPAWLYVVGCFLLSLLAVLVAQGLGLLTSVLAKTAGIAVGLTLGCLFALPGIMGVLQASVKLPALAQYMFFAQVLPAATLADRPAPGAGVSHLPGTVISLVFWAVLFLAASGVMFQRRDEIA
jgi:ABC-type transport system involved in multi-copper enzyme maturation permease subunit